MRQTQRSRIKQERATRGLEPARVRGSTGASNGVCLYTDSDADVVDTDIVVTVPKVWWSAVYFSGRKNQFFTALFFSITSFSICP